MTQLSPSKIYGCTMEDRADKSLKNDRKIK